MIKLYIGSALDPKEVITPTDTSVKDLFRNNGINVQAQSVITLNARRLGDAELVAPISSLGIVDGDMITMTEKLTSAR